MDPVAHYICHYKGRLCKESSGSLGRLGVLYRHSEAGERRLWLGQSYHEPPGRQTSTSIQCRYRIWWSARNVIRIILVCCAVQRLAPDDERTTKTFLWRWFSLRGCFTSAQTYSSASPSCCCCCRSTSTSRPRSNSESSHCASSSSSTSLEPTGLADVRDAFQR